MSAFDNVLGGGLLTKALMFAVPAVAVMMALRLMSPATAGEVISASEAHARASKGEITLVDVRTPDEWKQTGVPASAHTITMHQPGPQLLKQLDAVLGGDRTKPLAIICRTGNRTGSLSGALKNAGYVNLIDVSEGMAGGRAGQGWLRTGLPTRKWAPGQEKPVKLTEQK